MAISTQSTSAPLSHFRLDSQQAAHFFTFFFIYHKKCYSWSINRKKWPSKANLSTFDVFKVLKLQIFHGNHRDYIVMRHNTPETEVVLCYVIFRSCVSMVSSLEGASKATSTPAKKAITSYYSAFHNHLNTSRCFCRRFRRVSWSNKILCSYSESASLSRQKINIR